MPVPEPMIFMPRCNNFQENQGSSIKGEKRHRFTVESWRSIAKEMASTDLGTGVRRLVTGSEHMPKSGSWENLKVKARRRALANLEMDRGADLIRPQAKAPCLHPQGPRYPQGPVRQEGVIKERKNYRSSFTHFQI